MAISFAKKALILGISFIGLAGAKYDFSPIINMEDYASDFRVTDCFECFDARGKFCHDKNY